jgi:hypothetical protein
MQDERTDQTFSDDEERFRVLCALDGGFEEVLEESSKASHLVRSLI